MNYTLAVIRVATSALLVFGSALDCVAQDQSPPSVTPSSSSIASTQDASPAPSVSQSSSTVCTPAPVANEERLKVLGDHFLQKSMHYRAIGAFEELSLFARSPATQTFARLRMATSYHLAGQYRDGLALYDDLLKQSRLEPAVDTSVRIQRAVARAEQGIELGDGEAAASSIAELDIYTRDPTPAAAWAQYHLARLALVSGERDRAQGAVSSLRGACGDGTQSPCTLLRTLEGAAQLAPPRRRIPVVGAVLSSLVPGLGSVYAEHYVDALYYLALTSGTAALAYDIHEPNRRFDDQKVSFYVVGGVSLLFYVANVVRGYVDSSRFNEVERHEFRKLVLAKVPARLPLEPGSGTVDAAPKCDEDE